MARQQWLVFLPLALASGGLAACASVLGGEEVKVRPVNNMQTLTAAPRDALYESAVSAINERDYGRALEYLQAAKARDPRNVKALNALGVVYDKLGRFDLSARYYAQARAIEPDSKIVAENMGYSRVLQRLLNPNQPIAVANIDLPPGLINPASPAGAPPPAPTVVDKAAGPSTVAPTVPVLLVTEKKVIDAPPPTMTAMPLELPDAKHLFADVVLPEPVMPVTEKKVIDTPLTVTAMPLELRDAKHLSADLPELVVPVTEKKVIDTPPPTVTAMAVDLPDAKHLLAGIVLPEPVMPVTEKKVIDTPPPTVVAMPLELRDAKQLFADVVLPEPVMPVTERKVIDAAPPAVTAAPFLLPDTKPLFAASLSPAVLSLPVPGTEGLAPAKPVLSAATMAVVPAPSVAAVPVSPAPIALVMTAVEQKAVVESAPSAAMVPVAAPVKPAIAAISVSSVQPQSEAKIAAAAVPAVPAMPVAQPTPVAPRSLRAGVEKKATVPTPAPAVIRSIVLPVAKPVVVAAATPAAPMAEKMAIAAPVRVSAKPAVAAPVRSIAAQSTKRIVAKPVTAAVAARPAVPALPARQLASAAPVKLAAVTRAPAKGKVLTIGQPIKLVNASGKQGGAGTVLRRLTSLGWTMRPADSRSQLTTVLYYPVQNLAAAKAMQRTLPFPVRLIATPGKASGMQLVIGRDYLSWKPRNTRIAALWQKRMVIASSQKLSLRGVR